MTRYFRTSILCLLTAVYCAPAFGATARWTGKGETDKASDGRNWDKGKVPGNNDYVVFNDLSAKDCAWDLDVQLYYLAIKKAYKGTISLQNSRLTVTKNVNVEGGKLDLQEGSLTVGRRVYVGSRGAFDLSNGTLSVGPTGILVDAGGTFLSTGHSQARIMSAKHKRYYKFIVGRGNVTMSNPAGTEVTGSQGMTLYSKAKVSQADFVNVKQIKPGTAAVKVFAPKGRNQAQKLELKGWTFDETVKKKAGSQYAKFEEPVIAVLEPEAGAAGEAPTVVVLTPAQLTEAPATAESAVVTQAVPLAEVPAAEEPQGEPFAGLEEYETAKAEANFLPFLAVQFNGGQHFFQSEKGNLSGNLNVLASMVVKHEKLGRWTIVPLLSSQYQGTKQVTDLVGGGTLFQERMAHSVAVRGVYQLSPKWKLKPGVGYKWELLKETRDEAWGDGLFDYRRPGFSLEGEYTYKDPFSFRVGYDYYHIGFVNFVSLESVIKDSLGNSMARELAGSSVLDSNNHSFSFGGTVQGPWRSYAEGNLATTFRLFPDQHVVNKTGDYRNTTRNDISNQLSVAWRVPREISGSWKAVGGVRMAAGYNRSNQNSYDAQRLKFLKNYYDSTSIRAGVDLNLYHKLPARQAGGKEDRPLEFSLSATLGRVGYLGRLAQDASGLYLGDSIYQNEAVLSLGVSYPIAPHFVWTSQFGYGSQTSNQNFERLYKYNFTTTNYRFGFGYQF